MATDDQPTQTGTDPTTEPTTTDRLDDIVTNTTGNEDLSDQLREYAAPGLAVLGSLLPWATFQAPIVGSQSASGLDTDLGYILILCAAGFIYAGRKELDRGRLIAGGAAMLTMVWGFLHIQGAFNSAQSEMAGSMFSGSVQMGFGIGFYLALIGSAVMAYMAYQEYSAQQEEVQ